MSKTKFTIVFKLWRWALVQNNKNGKRHIRKITEV